MAIITNTIQYWDRRNSFDKLTYCSMSFIISLHSCHGNDSSHGEFRDKSTCWRMDGMAWGRDADVVINQRVASGLSAPFTVDVTLTGAGVLTPAKRHEPVIFNSSRGVSSGPAGVGIPPDGRANAPSDCSSNGFSLQEPSPPAYETDNRADDRHDADFDKTSQKVAARIILIPTELKLEWVWESVTLSFGSCVKPERRQHLENLQEPFRNAQHIT